MSGKLVNEQYLYDIANAIRSKNGESTLYRPQDMGNAVLDIQTIDTLTISYLEQQITSYSNDTITYIKPYAFDGFRQLTSVNIPAVTTIDFVAFQNCQTLPSIILPSVTSIGNSVFFNCYLLESITISTNSVCQLGSNVFYNTPIASGNGYIYVPANLVDSYKADANWSTYANQIVAISNE